MTSPIQPESDHASKELDIHAPDLTVDQLMIAIRNDIQRRRTEAEVQGIDFNGMSRRSLGVPCGERFPATLYDALYRASTTQKATKVSLLVTPLSVPLLGGIIQRMRALLHHLVLFYVNMAAEKQMVFNVEMTRAMNQLVDALDHESNQAILLDELRKLNRRLVAIENRLDSSGSNQDTVGVL